MLHEISPPNESLWSQWDVLYTARIHYSKGERVCERAREQVGEQTAVHSMRLSRAA